MKKIAYILPILGIVVLGLVAGVRAQDSPNTGDNVLIGPERQIESDYFAAGGNVRFSGTANSDAYVAGGQVIIDGTVKGDLLVAGGNVTVDGSVEGDIRAAGGQIYINGKVGKNVTLFGGNVTLAKSGNVAGNVVAAGGLVDLTGQVGGDVRAGSGALNLNGNVGGSVDAAVDTLSITSSAKIGEALTYISENDAVVADGAVLNGITKKLPPKNEGAKAGFWGARIAGMLMTVFTALILAWLFPGSLKRGAEILRSKPLLTLGIGFATIILVPIVAALLLFTVIGLPLGVLGLVGYFCALYLSAFFVIGWVGEQITKTFKLDYGYVVTVLIGAAFFSLIGLIPILGEMLMMASALLGMGILAQKAVRVLRLSKSS